MLYFSRWKALATLLTALVICLFAVPNFFSDATIKSLPAWAQRHVVLGLDLQGGSHILLEVDANYVRKEKAEAFLGSLLATHLDHGNSCPNCDSTLFGGHGRCLAGLQYDFSHRVAVDGFSWPIGGIPASWFSA